MNDYTGIEAANEFHFSLTHQRKSFSSTAISPKPLKFAEPRRHRETFRRYNTHLFQHVSAILAKSRFQNTPEPSRFPKKASYLPSHADKQKIPSLFEPLPRNPNSNGFHLEKFVKSLVRVYSSYKHGRKGRAAGRIPGTLRESRVFPCTYTCFESGDYVGMRGGQGQGYVAASTCNGFSFSGSRRGEMVIARKRWIFGERCIVRYILSLSARDS